MKAYKPFLILFLAGVCLLASFPAGSSRILPAGTALAAEADDWRKEFDDLCSKTQEAMSLSPQELRALIDRCDKLMTKIEALEETQKKVYMKRLQRCRDLFSFTLETKENKQS